MTDAPDRPIIVYTDQHGATEIIRPPARFWSLTLSRELVTLPTWDRNGGPRRRSTNRASVTYEDHRVTRQLGLCVTRWQLRAGGRRVLCLTAVPDRPPTSAETLDLLRSALLPGETF